MLKLQITSTKLQTNPKSQIPNFCNFVICNLFGNWKLEIGNSGRRGYTLLFAILIMGILSITTISLASIVLHSLRAARELDDATVAFYAAEAGNEEALYLVGQGSPCTALNTTGEVALSNGATFKRVCVTDAAQMLIRSTGNFGKAKMALQVRIPL